MRGICDHTKCGNSSISDVAPFGSVKSKALVVVHGAISKRVASLSRHPNGSLYDRWECHRYLARYVTWAARGGSFLWADDCPKFFQFQSRMQRVCLGHKLMV